MTQVPPIGAAALASQFGQTTGTNQVDYDSFLKLLVAQLKNQDPLSPMESTDYIAQLATFSQVEQSIQMNRKLEDMLAQNTLTQATGLIGREIESMDGEIKGVVKAVELYSDGIVAVLEDGRKIAMSPGVVIRNPSGAEEPPEAVEPPPGSEPDDAPAEA